MVWQCQTMSFFLEKKSRTSASARPQTAQEVSFVVVKITAWCMLRRRFAVYDFWWVLKAWRFYNFLSLYLPCLLWIWLISGGFILVVDFKWERKRCRRGQRTRTQARTQLPTDRTRISSSTIASIVALTSSSLVPLSSLSS